MVSGTPPNEIGLEIHPQLRENFRRKRLSGEAVERA